MTARRWSRRTALALCILAAAVTGNPSPATASTVSVGDLIFAVPVTISEGSARQSTGSSNGRIAFGAGWQWVGQAGGHDALPATVVLARGDIVSTNAGEVLGLALAGSAAGMLPDLRLTKWRSRPMSDEGEKTRIGLQYSAGPGVTYHGELLIATRPTAPAAVLVVLGTEDLTAGTIDSILESARWRS